MAEYSHSEKIAAPADKVWATVRQFGDGSWMGVEMMCDGEGEGAVRRIAMGGGSIAERCERVDDEARVLGYTIVDGAVPFTDYHSTMEVAEDGRGSLLTWSATYEPIGDPAQAESVVQMIYSNGSQALKRYLED